MLTLKCGRSFMPRILADYHRSLSWPTNFGFDYERREQRADVLCNSSFFISLPLPPTR